MTHKEEQVARFYNSLNLNRLYEPLNLRPALPFFVGIVRPIAAALTRLIRVIKMPIAVYMKKLSAPRSPYATTWRYTRRTTFPIISATGLIGAAIPWVIPVQPAASFNLPVENSPRRFVISILYT